MIADSCHPYEAPLAHPRPERAAYRSPTQSAQRDTSGKRRGCAISKLQAYPAGVLPRVNTIVIFRFQISNFKFLRILRVLRAADYGFQISRFQIWGHLPNESASPSSFGLRSHTRFAHPPRGLGDSTLGFAPTRASRGLVSRSPASRSPKKIHPSPKRCHASARTDKGFSRKEDELLAPPL